MVGSRGRAARLTRAYPNTGEVRSQLLQPDGERVPLRLLWRLRYSGRCFNRVRYLKIACAKFWSTAHKQAKRAGMEILAVPLGFSSKLLGAQFFCPMIETKSTISESIFHNAFRQPFSVFNLPLRLLLRRS